MFKQNCNSLAHVPQSTACPSTIAERFMMSSPVAGYNSTPYDRWERVTKAGRPAQPPHSPRTAPAQTTFGNHLRHPASGRRGRLERRCADGVQLSLCRRGVPLQPAVFTGYSVLVWRTEPGSYGRARLQFESQLIPTILNNYNNFNNSNNINNSNNCNDSNNENNYLSQDRRMFPAA